MILMKRFLLIIILGFLWSGNAYSNCYDDLDASWKYADDKRMMIWSFKNKNNKNIKITKIGLKSKDGKTMYEQQPQVRDDPEGAVLVGDEDFYIKPFGATRPFIYPGKLNFDVAGKGFYNCIYGTITYTNQTNSSSSSTSSKSKQKSNNSGSSKSLLKKLLGKD